MVAQRLDAKAEVTLDKADGGFAITAVHLTVEAVIPGASAQAFEDAARKARPAARCPGPEGEDHHGRATEGLRPVTARACPGQPGRAATASLDRPIPGLAKINLTGVLPKRIMRTILRSGS